jgi:hypothetical protein
LRIAGIETMTKDLWGADRERREKAGKTRNDPPPPKPLARAPAAEAWPAFLTLSFPMRPPSRLGGQPKKCAKP